MPQDDPQDDHAPEHRHRVIVTPLAPRGAERIEQLAIRQRGEQILDGLQRGIVFLGPISDSDALQLFGYIKLTLVPGADETVLLSALFS